MNSLGKHNVISISLFSLETEYKQENISNADVLIKIKLDYITSLLKIPPNDFLSHMECKLTCPQWPVRPCVIWPSVTSLIIFLLISPTYASLPLPVWVLFLFLDHTRHASTRGPSYWLVQCSFKIFPKRISLRISVKYHQVIHF